MHTLKKVRWRVSLPLSGQRRCIRHNKRYCGWHHRCHRHRSRPPYFGRKIQGPGWSAQRDDRSWNISCSFPNAIVSYRRGFSVWSHPANVIKAVKNLKSPKRPHCTGGWCGSRYIWCKWNMDRKSRSIQIQSTQYPSRETLRGRWNIHWRN